MKHACQQDSEESSDFEDEAGVMPDSKMSYQMAQRILRKHHLQVILVFLFCYCHL